MFRIIIKKECILMRNKIVSLLLSLVLTANVLTCLISFTNKSPISPLKPKGVLEAPILQAWIAWYKFISGGGTWWGGGDPRPRPSGN